LPQSAGTKSLFASFSSEKEEFSFLKKRRKPYSLHARRLSAA
jgi:hypothetical protein